MFTALLDTCVLVPSTQRDVLLECASTGIYRPVWSQAVLDELAYTLTRNGGRSEAKAINGKYDRGVLATKSILDTTSDVRAVC